MRKIEPKTRPFYTNFESYNVFVEIIIVKQMSAVLMLRESLRIVVQGVTSLAVTRVSPVTSSFWPPDLFKLAVSLLCNAESPEESA